MKIVLASVILSTMVCSVLCLSAKSIVFIDGLLQFGTPAFGLGIGPSSSHWLQLLADILFLMNCLCLDDDRRNEYYEVSILSSKAALDLPFFIGSLMR